MRGEGYLIRFSHSPTSPQKALKGITNFMKEVDKEIEKYEQALREWGDAVINFVKNRIKE